MSTPAITPTDDVVFDEKQQAKLEEIVKKASARAGSEGRQQAAEYKTQFDKAMAEINQLKQDLAAAKTPKERKEVGDEIADLQAQVTEMKNARAGQVAEIDGLRSKNKQAELDIAAAKAEALDQKKKNKINVAATKEDFVDMNVVMALTEKNIVWNDSEHKWVVINDDGQPRMNAGFDPMTVEEFYQDYAVKHPYLVKGRVTPGAGSGGSNGAPASLAGRYTVEQIFGTKSDAKAANDLAMKNPAEYKRLRAEAVAKRIIA